MSAKTQNINEILDIAENLYEAAMVIAKRARQINEELYQKKRDRQILEELDGGFEEELLHADVEEQDTKTIEEDEENPVIVAQKEFLERQLEFNYEAGRRQASN